MKTTTKTDRSMLKVTGFDDEEADELSNELYPRLHEEIIRF